jgi:hypothetical protein
MNRSRLRKPLKRAEDSPNTVRRTTSTASDPREYEIVADLLLLADRLKRARHQTLTISTCRISLEGGAVPLGSTSGCLRRIGPAVAFFGRPAEQFEPIGDDLVLHPPLAFLAPFISLDQSRYRN